MYDLIIVGCGLFGATMASLAKEKGLKCLVLERRNVCGGNIFDDAVEDFYVSKYGAHIFHTDDVSVWDFVRKFSDFNDYTHRVVVEKDGKLYHIPVCGTTFKEVFGIKYMHEIQEILNKEHGLESYANPQNLKEMAINLVGRKLYELLIKDYTEKQWGRPTTELPKEIIERLPVRMNFDTRYFSDRYQGMPTVGYTQMIKRMIHGIEVLYGIDFNQSRQYWIRKTKTIIYTGMIDELLDFKYGALEYRSLLFETCRIEKEFSQQNAVINNACKRVPYTRTIEHKHFYKCSHAPYTILTKEYPQKWEKGKDAFYPVNDEKNKCLYQKYKHEANIVFPNIIFGGRLGCYEYNDMDDTVKKAMELFRTFMF